MSTNRGMFSGFHLAVSLMAAVGLAACGSGAAGSASPAASKAASAPVSVSPAASTSAASSASKPASASTAASPSAAGSAAVSAGGTGCGTFGFVAPPDPDGAMAKLPPAVQQTYNGYSAPVQASPWANWKPTHQPPYTVGIAWTQPVNDWIKVAHGELVTALQKDKTVGKVIDLAAAPVADVPTQLQQYQSLVQQKVDLIVLNPGTGQAFISAVDAAAKAGIPTVSAMTITPTKNAVNVLPSSYLPDAQMAAVIMKEIDGKGNVLEVHGIPTLSIDIDAFKAYAAVLARCPNVHVLGDVTGNFSPAQAKAATLQFLGTHPQPLSAVLISGGQATGVVGALQQAGRPVVPMTGGSGEKGFLGYWRQHRSTYKAVGTGGPPARFGDLFAATAIAMLNGRGVKVNAIVAPSALITDQNLDQWADASWTLETPGTASGPPNAIDVDALLKPVFTH